MWLALFLASAVANRPRVRCGESHGTQYGEANLRCGCRVAPPFYKRRRDVALMPGAHRKPPNDRLLLTLFVFFAAVAGVLLFLASRMR
jgi:hypothetical protein